MANTTLDHLAGSIERFAAKSVGYLNSDFSEEAQSFGAFCTRVILETACAALVGRLDPFRMLYLSEFQAQGGYEYGKPAKSGFKWTGDVLADDKPTHELWNTDHELSKISRALFSPYAEHVYWKPAAEAALDFVSLKQSSTVSDLGTIDPTTFTRETKGRLVRLYATLSKGVHWEFFISSVMMDEGTLKDAIRDCLLHVSRLAFVSHFVPTAYRCLQPEEALTTYTSLRGNFQ